jgi:hypothetical protein
VCPVVVRKSVLEGDCGSNLIPLKRSWMLRYSETIMRGSYLDWPSPDKRRYRYVWSAAELQAKNEEWQLVCANVFGLQWSQ